jgi:hypothetical protein
MAALAGLWLLMPLAAAAQDDGTLAEMRRAIELPAHRALMRVVADPATALAPFTTDGCSGGLSSTWSVVADLFPDFAEAHENRPPWEACCVAHDRRYHDAGGATEAGESYDARLAADEDLRACVIAGGEDRIDLLARHYDVSEDQIRLAYGAIGDAMFNAVRLGGGPCTGLPWRWGYGYPGCLTLLP